MQQDNAVGACAQASIWMALRTLRKREGNRAFDPAQITDAATKYFVNGRIRPNKQGLTPHQITGAIRAAGYAPHQINLAPMTAAMSAADIVETRMMLQAYVESAVPVVLLVAPPSGGHVLVIIGETALDKATNYLTIDVRLADNSSISFKHVASWAPALLVHNDNTGPYRELHDQSKVDYALQDAKAAIPLLPPDIFMSAEEAFAIGTATLAETFTALKSDGKDVVALASELALRLRLVDKRRLRSWGARGKLDSNLSAQLRQMDLPRKVWVFELHKVNGYVGQAIKHLPTLVGLLLIDPTADILPLSLLLLYVNYQELTKEKYGTLMTWDPESGLPNNTFKTDDAEPILAL